MAAVPVVASINVRISEGCGNQDVVVELRVLWLFPHLITI